MAVAARCLSVGGEGQGMATHGQGVGVEAVGTLQVVSIELSVVGLSDDEAVVHAEDERPLVVLGIEDALRREALVGVEGKIRGIDAGECDAHEDAALWLHGTGESGVVVEVVLNDEETRATRELALRVATGGKEEREEEQGEGFFHVHCWAAADDNSDG